MFPVCEHRKIDRDKVKIFNDTVDFHFLRNYPDLSVYNEFNEFWLIILVASSS